MGLIILHRRRHLFLILFLVIRKIIRFHIADIMLYCFGHLVVHIEVLPEKPWFEFCIDTKHIVHHQYLAVTIPAGADANGRDLYTF